MSKKPNAAKRKANNRMRIKRLDVIAIAVNQKTSLAQLDAMLNAGKKAQSK